MRWFKHDTDAHRDAKMQKLLIKYGADGYALYWYCIELIAGEVNASNLTFELEHDSELLGYALRIDTLKVEEIMRYMVDLGLFEISNDRITCLKLLKRIDLSQGGSAGFRKNVKEARTVMTQSGNSHDSVTKETALEVDVEVDIDIDKHLTSTPGVSQATSPKSPPVPYQRIVDLYHETLPDLPRVQVISKKRQSHIRQRHNSVMEKSLDTWREYFTAVGNTDFLMGRIPGKDWRANFDFLISERAVIGVMEGKYVSISD